MAKFAIKKVFKPIKHKTIKTNLITTALEKEVKGTIEETIKPQQEIVEGEKVVEAIMKDKKVNDMNTKDKITYANAILANQEDAKVKKVRKDKGLIERTESSKIILTEDNKELLND